MELKELCERVLDLFKCDDTSQLSKKLFETVINNDISKIQDFLSIVNDLSVDWLQKIFQYYEADRTDKKQDYTPKSICKLASELTETGGKIVYDVCAGSGALTIQKWNRNPNKTFICEELDSKVIPFLLFNMALRNMNGYVISRNVLTLELSKCYQIVSGERFSTVKEVKEVPEIQADEIISNPPYNIKWNAPEPMFADERFKGKPIPPTSNANYAFIFTALSRMKNNGKCAFILPCGALSSDIERKCRQWLIDNGYIEKVIALPDKMFESTSIPTCVVLISCNNKRIEMFDCRRKAIQEQREQNGQFGGASHEKRTYYKTVNILSDELINVLCSKCQDVSEFSVPVQQNDIQDSILTVSRYIKFETQEVKHRNLQEIADNINYITKMQNSCKLVVNETIAKSLGLDIEQFKESKQQSIKTSKQMKALGLDFVSEDYITFTKAKNEFVFKCNDKDIFPEILRQFFAVWKNQIAVLNTMQHQYLTELRDALLPDLISGKIKL